MELNGKITAVLPPQSGQGRNGEWTKNAFVLEWQDNGYAQHLCLEVLGTDKWEKMKQNVVVGNDVQVRFNVTSREWNGRWFTTCNCWYCSTLNAVQKESQQPQQVLPQTQTEDLVPF